MSLSRHAAAAFLAALSMAGAACASVAEAPVQQVAPQASVAALTPPKLIVTIVVDQFSANLFNQYRSRYTGG
ncbi:MAG: alkaline phosphatase family protein, partial [Brevundimonas sp.]